MKHSGLALAATAALIATIAVTLAVRHPRDRSPPAALRQERSTAAAVPVSTGPPAERRPVPSGTPDSAPPIEPSIQGHVRVQDADGTEHRHEDGRLVLTIIDETGGHVSPAIAIAEGRWRLALDRPAAEIVVNEVVLGGRAAVVLQPRHRVPQDGTVDLRARWPATLLVHVVDAERGTELEQVTLAMAQSGQGAADSGPGARSEADVLARGSSPLRVTGPAEALYRDGLQLAVRATAPDRCPACETLDFGQRGEATIALAGAAALEVTLRHRPPEALPLVLRLWQRPAPEERERPGEREREVPAAPTGVTRMEELLPGKSIVSAEIRGASPRLELARADVDLVAGSTTSIDLALADAPPLVEGVPLAGTLEIPGEWDRVDPVLTIKLESRAGCITRHEDANLLAAGLHVPGAPGRFAWDAGPVTQGHYRLVLRSPPFTWEIDVGPAGARGVALAVPHPADVRLVLVDAEDARGVNPRQVLWSVLTSTGYENGDERPYSRRPDGVVSFQTLVGHVTIDASAEDHEDVSATVDLHPGSNEITLRMPRACGLRLDASVDGQLVDWPFHFPEIEAIDGDGTPGWQSSSRSLLSIEVSKPGRYRITVAEDEGYEPVPAFEVQIPAREFVHRTIALQRR